MSNTKGVLRRGRVDHPGVPMSLPEGEAVSASLPVPTRSGHSGLRPPVREVSESVERGPDLVLPRGL